MFISYFCWPLSRGNKIHLLALFKTHQGVCLFHKTPDLWFYRGLYVGLFLLYVTSTKYNSLIHAGRQILTRRCVWFTWLITTSFCLADLKALNQKKKHSEEDGGRSLGGCDEDGLLFRPGLRPYTGLWLIKKLLHICKTRELPLTPRSTRRRHWSWFTVG